MLFRIFLIFIVLLLFSCAPKEKIVYKYKYIKPHVSVPSKPEMDNVVWTKVGSLYCLDKENSKKLMINIYKLDSYINQLLLIIKNNYYVGDNDGN